MNKLIDDRIRLEESTHTYLLDDSEDISFTSVTTFIGQFFDEFDAEKIATKLVKTHPRYQDTTVEEVVAKWQSQTDRGTEVHKQLELYIKDGIYPTDPKAIPGVKFLEKYLKDTNIEVLSEVILYSKEWKIAGTIDVILYDSVNKKYYLVDWKTSKKIEQTSFGSKMGKAQETSDIMDCNYYHYVLQLSLYSFLLETFYGIKPDNLTIIQLKENEYVEYQLPNMRDKVIDMLNSRMSKEKQIETNSTSSDNIEKVSIDKIKTFGFSSQLGWSKSRYGTFQTCKRKYFYQYYGKHDNEFESKHIAQLKSLASVAMEAGSMAHEIISDILKFVATNGKAPSLDKVIGRIQRNKGKFLEKQFAEQYYNGTDVIDENSFLEKVTLCVTNFYNSDRFKWIMENAINTRQQWIIEPEGYGETRINGLKAYCKVDCLFPVDGTIVIIDWKTGKERPEDIKQLKGYATSTKFQFDVNADDIICIASYLDPEYKENVYQFDDFDLIDFNSAVKLETQNMTDILSNVEKNIPMVKDNFPLAESSNLCGYCNYRELCER
jgi:hypothetical protein